MTNRHSPSFFYFQRQMRTYFYTSSLEKLAQARYVFGRLGCKLEHYKSPTEPYDEDYSSTETLLRKAIAQVRGDFGRRGVFFVEDTSLRIEAFSHKSDVPGVAVKEWFAETSFEKLDAQLRE